jgi:hypothetical protein
MPSRPVPRRHWRSYGNNPLPSGEQALDEPLRAFPSWFLRIVCERCGKERMISETHMPQRDMLIRDILDRMRQFGRPASATVALNSWKLASIHLESTDRR